MYDRLKLGVVRLHGEEGDMRHDSQPVATKVRAMAVGLKR
jgi:hypothetical protein